MHLSLDTSVRPEGVYEYEPPDWQPRSVDLTVDHWIISKPHPKDMELFRSGVKTACKSWQKPCSSCQRQATKQCICSRDTWRCDKCLLWHVSSDFGRKSAIDMMKHLKAQAAQQVIVVDDDKSEESDREQESEEAEISEEEEVLEEDGDMKEEVDSAEDEE